MPLVGCWLLGGFVVQVIVGLLDLKGGNATGGNTFLFFSAFFMLVSGLEMLLKYNAIQAGTPLDGRIDGYVWSALTIVVWLWTPAFWSKFSLLSIIVVLLDIVEDRLALGRQLGADHTINLTQVMDVTDSIRQALRGLLADIVFEMTGQASVVTTALNAVKKGGKLVAVSIYHAESSIPMIDVVRKQLTINGSICYTYDEFAHCIHLLQSGKVKVAPLVSHRFALAETEQALEVINAKKAMKVLLHT